MQRGPIWHMRSSRVASPQLKRTSAEADVDAERSIGPRSHRTRVLTCRSSRHNRDDVLSGASLRQPGRTTGAERHRNQNEKEVQNDVNRVGALQKAALHWDL